MKKSLIIFSSVGIIALVGLFLGNQYYDDHFYSGSHLGAIDVSGLTLSEAQSSLNDELAQQPITFTENGEEVGQIPMSKLITLQNSDQVIENYFEEQHQSTHWLKALFNDDVHAADAHLEEHIQVDQTALQQELKNIGVINSERRASENAALQYDEATGYSIKEEVQGNTIHIETLAPLVSKSDVVALEEAYQTPTVTQEDPILQEQLTKIQTISDTQVTLTFDEAYETIPKEQIMKWINLTDAGEITLDEAAIAEYLTTYNDKYATIDKPRPFQSTLSGEVTVDPGILGWSIDREREAAAIAEVLSVGNDVTREPIKMGHEVAPELAVGDSYIEVDLTEQHMFVYIDGEKVVETPIISGRDGSNTTPGAYYIWNKETPSVLRGFSKWTGEEYATPVSYWLPFDWVGQGVHDADWQSDFGGDTWINSGSLGCINTPPEIMDDVFNAAYVGMPVLVF